MGSTYPSTLDTFATNKANATATTTDHPAHHNDLADAVNKIERAIGVNPNGVTSGPDDDTWRTGTLTGWTEVNPSGTQTLTVGRGRLSVLHDDIVANDIGAIVKPLTGEGVGSVLETDLSFLAAQENFTMGGLVFSDGTAVGSAVAILMLYVAASGTIIETRGGTFQTVGAAVGTGPVFSYSNVGGPMHIRWQWQAANNFRASFSPDGVSWFGYAFADSGITLAPTHGGVFWSGWGASTARISSFGPFIHDAP